MRLQADIHREGSTKHTVWDATTSTAVPIARPVAVEIIEIKVGALLLRLDIRGDCLADTWHEDVEAAKRQAEFEYGVRPDDWTAKA